MSIVLITGCSTGIGLHTALAFARHGDTVVATMRNPAKASALHAAAAQAGVAVDVVALDVTSDASAQAAVADVLKRHGRIDVLVNNAGVGLSGPVEDFPEDQARTCMETNFWGPVRMARLVLPGMRGQGCGVIVNVSSITGRLPSFPTYAFYAAGKHAMGALSESLAAEVAPFGIRVVCIEPGYFNTALSDTMDTLLGQLDAASPYVEVSRFMADFSKQALINGGIRLTWAPRSSSPSATHRVLCTCTWVPMLTPSSNCGRRRARLSPSARRLLQRCSGKRPSSPTVRLPRQIQARQVPAL